MIAYNKINCDYNMKEKFTPPNEQNESEKLKGKWNHALYQVAEKIFEHMSQKLPEGTSSDQIPQLLEQATEERILTNKNRSDFIVISASPGTGKSTVGDILKQKGLERFPRVTTREPRPREKDGEDYHFISRKEFEQRKNEGKFLYHKETYGEGRAIAKDEFDDKIASGKKFYAEGDALAYSEIKKKSGYEEIEYQSVYLLPPSFDVLLERIAKRIEEDKASSEGKWDEAALTERLNKAIYYLEKSSGHIINGIYDGFLVNDDIKRVEEKVTSFI